MEETKIPSKNTTPYFLAQAQIWSVIVLKKDGDKIPNINGHKIKSMAKIVISLFLLGLSSRENSVLLVLGFFGERRGMWLGGGINIPTNQPTKLLFLYPLGWELNVLYGLVGKWKILRIRESEKRTLKEVNLWPENVIFWERKEEPKSSSLLNNNRG